MTIYIGVDQSIAACGVAVVRGIEVLHSSCTLTAPDDGSFRVGRIDQDVASVLFVISEPPTKAEDDGRRVDAVVRDFVAAYRLAQHEGRAVLYKPQEDIVVAIEAPAGSQSAVSAKCMGLAYGAIRGACYALGVVPRVVTARDAKEALTGSPFTAKVRVQMHAVRVFGGGWQVDKGKKRTKVEREAIADALAIVRCIQGGS